MYKATFIVTKPGTAEMRRGWLITRGMERVELIPLPRPIRTPTHADLFAVSSGKYTTENTVLGYFVTVNAREYKSYSE